MCDAIFEIDGYCSYAFTSFFAPVDSPPAVNAVKAGSAAPVKLSVGGDEDLAIFSWRPTPSRGKSNVTTGLR